MGNHEWWWKWCDKCQRWFEDWDLTMDECPNCKEEKTDINGFPPCSVCGKFSSNSYEAPCSECGSP